MEKGVYPQVPDLPGVPDAPPSYNQTFNPAGGAPSAPQGDFIPMASQGSIPMHPQPQPQMVIVQNQPIPPLGPRPCMVTCPSCQQKQMSTVRYETGTKTHLFAALLCIVGLFCCVCCPYFIDTCKNPNHYCSNCNAYLGMYK